MFRLIRFVFVILAAFVAGILYERDRRNDACIDAGGVWSPAGFCDRE